MNALLNGLKAALLGTWLVISMGFGWWLWHIKTTVETTMRDTHTTVLEIGLTAKNLKEASSIWEQSSKEQSTQTTLAMSHVNAVAERLSTLITKTDESLNVGLFPALTNAIQEQSAALLTNQTLLSGNLSQSSKVLADADAQINSPDIKIAMDNFATSSANLATATHEGAASMTDIHAALDYEIKQLEAPVTKLKTAGLIALTVIRKLYF